MFGCFETGKRTGNRLSLKLWIGTQLTCDGGPASSAVPNRMESRGGGEGGGRRCSAAKAEASVSVIRATAVRNLRYRNHLPQADSRAGTLSCSDASGGDQGGDRRLQQPAPRSHSVTQYNNKPEQCQILPAEAGVGMRAGMAHKAGSVLNPPASTRTRRALECVLISQAMPGEVAAILLAATSKTTA